MQKKLFKSCDHWLNWCAIILEKGAWAQGHVRQLVLLQVLSIILQCVKMKDLINLFELNNIKMKCSIDKLGFGGKNWFQTLEESKVKFKTKTNQLW